MAVDLSRGPYAVEWAAAREHNRLKRIEKLAGRLAQSILKDGRDKAVCEDADRLKARELLAEIAKGAV